MRVCVPATFTITSAVSIYVISRVQIAFLITLLNSTPNFTSHYSTPHHISHHTTQLHTTFHIALNSAFHITTPHHVSHHTTRLHTTFHITHYSITSHQKILYHAAFSCYTTPSHNIPHHITTYQCSTPHLTDG